MAKRDKTPDLLGEIVGKAAKQETTSTAVEQEKTRVNYYLPKDVLNELDKTQLELREMTGSRAISKSKIVHHAWMRWSAASRGCWA